MDTGDRDQGNIDCAARLIKTVVAPPVGITAEQTASAKQLMDEVIVPKFQALIAGETTAQAMYDEIVKQATAVFGEDGCDLTDFAAAPTESALNGSCAYPPFSYGGSPRLTGGEPPFL